jgi:adenosylcobinamide kinase/adenosylcobinamide-phosphate guanylyltransferase
VDGLGMLVANWMAAGLDDEGVLVRVRELLEAARRAAGPVVLVTDEVGWGVVPEHPVARRFRDLLGLGNQEAAAAADEVYLVVAGVPLRLKPGGPAAEPGRPVPPPRGSAAP